MTLLGNGRDARAAARVVVRLRRNRCGLVMGCEAYGWVHREC